MERYIDKSIFISYRRDDVPEFTSKIYEALTKRFGQGAVFKDVDSIPLGVDYKERIRSVLDATRIAVVVIGEKWLRIKGESGQQRLYEPDDYVRMEVEYFLNRRIPVIPVYTGNAKFPREKELPPTIVMLAMRQGTAIRYEPNFDLDMRKLVRSLELQLGPGSRNLSRQKTKGAAYRQRRRSIDHESIDAQLLGKLRRHSADPELQYQIATRFYEGEGVEKNMVEAVAWYKKAAGLNHPRAQYRLGLMYEFGRGIPHDHGKAVEWLKKAEKSGIKEASGFLGQVI